MINLKRKEKRKVKNLLSQIHAWIRHFKPDPACLWIFFVNCGAKIELVNSQNYKKKENSRTQSRVPWTVGCHLQQTSKCYEFYCVAGPDQPTHGVPLLQSWYRSALGYLRSILVKSSLLLGPLLFLRLFCTMLKFSSLESIKHEQPQSRASSRKKGTKS